MNQKIISILLLLLVSYLLFSKDDLYEGFSIGDLLPHWAGGTKEDRKGCLDDATKGSCIREWKSMHKECPQACLLSDKKVGEKRKAYSESTMKRHSPDQHKLCWKWAMKGECEKNPNYMKTTCNESCGIISDHFNWNDPQVNASIKNMDVLNTNSIENVSIKKMDVLNTNSIENVPIMKKGPKPTPIIKNDSICSNVNRIECIKQYITPDSDQLRSDGLPSRQEMDTLLKLLNSSANKLNMSIEDRNDAISIMMLDVIKGLHGPTGDRALRAHVRQPGTHLTEENITTGLPSQQAVADTTEN
jgi:hypothetical protein